ncbi:ABC transporter permease [Siminovitchia sediminis]|uniref:ABC transporter permease n=1 Tax=Siminovitchia sediminis TaxID=1274353 RepID=A0ABW4KMC2_9BACI
MTFSWKRVNAIFVKDYKDFSRNYAVSTIIFLPPIMAAFYGRMGNISIEAHYLVFNMAFTMVAAFVQCCLIAEEKEKNTLRGLMLSPASTLEILGGKSLLSILLTIFVILLSAFFSDYRPEPVGIISIAMMLSILFYIALGTLLGLYARSVMEASLIIMPVMIVFSFGTFLTSLTERYPVLKIIDYLPNVQLLELAKQMESGGGMADIFSNLAIIAAWLIVTSICTVIVFRKRMVD